VSTPRSPTPQAIFATCYFGLYLSYLVVTEKGVARGVQTSRVLVARDAAGTLAGTLRLATKKPWAIDPTYFVGVRRPLYLIDMAVDPAQQGRGIGRLLLDEADTVARAFPAQAIRLDAYDAAAGAGAFYAKCGYREVRRVTYRGTPLVYFERLLDDAPESPASKGPPG
jgi:GNAT superfamily N-acetyltransferase